MSKSRVLIEGAVIVGSILLAFGIQAAWDQREAGLEESANLAALLTDLDVVISEAELRISQDEVYNAEMRTLLDSLETPPADSALAGILYRVARSRVVRAQMDAYSDLVASGGISNIGDAELRRLLARASYDLWLTNRVSEEMGAFNNAEFVEILNLAATDPDALIPRLRLYGEMTIRGRSFYNGRKREAVESAVEAREAVRAALDDLE